MEDIDNIKTENEELKQKLLLLEKENQELREHLKKYTAPSRSKKYYEIHKEELLNKMKENPIPSDKKKEYNKNYYLKKKLSKNNNI